MSALTETIHGSDEGTLTRAAETLRAGGLVIVPTETVYGVAASAASAEALAALRRLADVEAAAKLSRASTWHAPSVEAVIEALKITAPLHLRLLRLFAPGPVRFLVEMEAPAAGATIARLRAETGAFDADGAVSVRIPDHPATAEVLAAAGVPVVAEWIPSIVGSGRELPPGIIETARVAGISVVVDAGPTRFGKPSTAVRLLAPGGYRVVSEGAVEERYIRKKMERLVLFVCTGNTCRSPMAEAIARAALESAAAEATTPGVAVRVVSAGVAARSGAPMTPEAAEALSEMGIDPGDHRSRPLSRELIAEAEIIFTMTRGHRDAVLDEDSTASGKVHVLDPKGGDVPDPIGGTQDDYRQSARRIRAMVESRLADLAAEDRRGGS